MKPFDPESLPTRSSVPASVRGAPSKTIVDGRIISLSVSNLSKFREEEDGCELRWYLKLVQGWAEPTRSFTEVGDIMHDQLDHYLSTGENVLGKLALQGFDLLPQPGPRPDLRVEWGLDRNPRPRKDGKKLNYYSVPVEQSKLRAGGIPLIGFIDVEDSSDVHVLPGGSLIQEPDVVECLDHKSTGDGKWAKRAEDFLKTTQMSGYGRFLAGLPEYENISEVRLSQTYYLTKPLPDSPKAFKRSIVVPVDAIIATWDTTTGLCVDRMKSAASERDERKIKPNLAACGNFGGCPHRDHCWAFKETTPLEKLKMTLSKKSKSNAVPTPEANTMSNLLNKVRGITTPTNGVPNSLPGLPAAQLTAKDSVNGGGYKFSTGVVGMAMGPVDLGGQVVYSFLLVDATTGKAGSEPFQVLPTEPVILVNAPPQAQTAAQFSPPGGAPTNTPWIPTTAAPPISATATPVVPKLGGKLKIQDVPNEQAASPVPSVPKLGRPKKDPVDRRAQVEEAFKTSHEVFSGLYGVEATFEQASTIAALLLG